jgi:hypothetical protein
VPAADAAVDPAALSPPLPLAAATACSPPLAAGGFVASELQLATSAAIQAQFAMIDFRNIGRF